MWKPNPVLKWTVMAFWFALFTIGVITLVASLMRETSDLSVFFGATLLAAWFSIVVLIITGLIDSLNRKAKKLSGFSFSSSSSRADAAKSLPGSRASS